MRSALPLVTLACAAVLLLGGCAPQDPMVVPAPEQSADPVFATDEEALAAATDAYRAYLKMSDLIAQEGGKNPERIAPYVTEEWLEKELIGFDALASTGRHQIGESAFSNIRLQRLEESVHYSAISIYVCHDATGVRILDGTDTDVTPIALATPWTIEVTFEITQATHQLLLEGSEPWVRTHDC